MIVLYTYLILAFVLDLPLVYCTIMCFKKKNSIARTLGITSLMSCLASTSYILSVVFQDIMTKSIFSSLFFISLDLTLVYLFAFCLRYTSYYEKKKITKIILGISIAYLIFETVLFTLNPFYNEFVCDITLGEEIVSGIFTTHYQFHVLYKVHLVYTYALVALCLLTLIFRSIIVPKEYRRKYLNIVVVIFGVVLLNAGFLFIPTKVFRTLDYSILTYGLCAIFIYYTTFNVAKKDLINNLKNIIFENFDQACVIFDYRNEFVLCNKNAKTLFPDIEFNSELNIFDFVEKTKIGIDFSIEDNFYSVLINIDLNGVTLPVKCELKAVYNERGQLLTRMLMFEDMTRESDLLTGFQNWESFKNLTKENNNMFDYPLSVCVVDIIGLSLYNEVNGHEKGNQLLKELSDKLREEFSQNSYFVRGREAALIVITYRTNEKQAIRKLNKIKKEFDDKIQYSCLEAKDPNVPIIDYVLQCFTGLNAKRLLDRNTVHSNTIKALVKALQQCDADTESHVKRTQVIGTALGKRIGLTDVEISNLSLLCLLHDIGKIGVPLEILNKPGKLTNEEFDIIKSHVIKGYNIAKSSSELNGIAEMIKYHHERWDGRGYPDGLSKEAIPLLSRIISVVDSFDAMVSDRCYRKAMSVSEAIAEVKRCAGTQFDPFIASEFIQLIEETEYYVDNNDKTEVKETEKVVENVEIRSNVIPVEYARYLLDSENKIIEITPEFTEITGYTSDDIKNKDIYQADLIPEEDRIDYTSFVTSILAAKPIAYIEHRLLCKDKTIKNVLCIGKVFYDPVSRTMRSDIIFINPQTTNYVEVLRRDIERKNEVRMGKWEEVGRKDSLTGLLTHKAFQNDIEHNLLNGNIVSLLMIDIDDFKTYNDTYGHQEGDEFLIQFANNLQTVAGDKALCCRMGGDEFAIAMFGKLDLNSTTKKIFNDLGILCQGLKHPVSMSIGACQSNDDINTFNKLYVYADKVLYTSKDKGKNQYTLHDEKKI